MTLAVSQQFIDTRIVSKIYMVKIKAPQPKNTPSSATAPKLKTAKHIEATTESVVSATALDERAPLPAPSLKAKTKKVDGAFGKEKVRAAPKAKVKATHNEKMAARKELKKTSKLKKKEALKSAKKLAKKAKRTAVRNAANRKSVGRNGTAG